MINKPSNPYEKLKNDFLRVISKIKFPETRQMWFYPKSKLSEGWKLQDLNERVQAADQLDWDCVLQSTDAGLAVVYRKRITNQDFPAQLR